ncbi:hypothetical protein MOO44_08385 [Nicoliella spurrieriana]|uniref:Uncharacterized protein n=1 Tax=Nicoliella spurrieriana TaxID=2925830 RepID=A0A976X5M3_9LACO|nr:hypothetical protein [Nicoliella spurrieriana]UQS86866.1 hypothetical protein MOO44_08385 [Nicoliella spurrieriana]
MENKVFLKQMFDAKSLVISVNDNVLSVLAGDHTETVAEAITAFKQIPVDQRTLFIKMNLNHHQLEVFTALLTELMYADNDYHISLKSELQKVALDSFLEAADQAFALYSKPTIEITMKAFDLSIVINSIYDFINDNLVELEENQVAVLDTVAELMTKQFNTCVKQI